MPFDTDEIKLMEQMMLSWEEMNADELRFASRLPKHLVLEYDEELRLIASIREKLGV